MEESIYSRKLYRRGEGRDFRAPVIIGTAAAALAGAAIVKLEPGKWWIELPVMILTWTALFFLVGGLTRRRKWGLVTAIGVVGGLILIRMGWLNWGGIGVWFLVVGLISLVN